MSQLFSGKDKEPHTTFRGKAPQEPQTICGGKARRRSSEVGLEGPSALSRPNTRAGKHATLPQTFPTHSNRAFPPNVCHVSSSIQFLSRKLNILIYNQIIYHKTLGYDIGIYNLCRKGFIGDAACTMIFLSS